MVVREVVLGLVVAGTVTASASAQSTYLPTYNAPYRVFERHEFGGSISFPGRSDAAFEGVYRIGSGTWDIGFRAGVELVEDPGDDIVLFGTTFRQRVITHNDEFPADGALILGAGARLADGFNQLVIPGGVSFGRRLNVEGSDVSIVPFVQPTILFLIGDGDDVDFSMGFGADFRLTPSFDLRVSAGLGDPDGVSIAAVWIR